MCPAAHIWHTLRETSQAASFQCLLSISCFLLKGRQRRRGLSANTAANEEVFYDLALSGGF